MPMISAYRCSQVFCPSTRYAPAQDGEGEVDVRVTFAAINQLAASYALGNEDRYR